ncbi:hypothetical protein B0I35DRAFT_479322 [Stachybotrys elegans]|uniref:LYC1 C-terminal domain-containing protein n=1 Tax=Stachybotrys elegans TaxID=80388 RepID=A0A8K0SU86_9HYPO|nr:hypothetical protein B0I35DRAFT_479322 [Stachybotrys elegans]
MCKKLISIAGFDEAVVFERAQLEQVAQHLSNNSHLLAGMLDKERYILSQLRMYNTKDCSYWVLRSLCEPTNILSSCTAVRVPVIFSSSKGCQSSTATIITDIATPVEYRRQGFATALLKNVQETLDKLDNPPMFSVIYTSGIHTDFVEKLGWKPQPGTRMRISIGRTEIPRPAQADRAQYYPADGLQYATSRDCNMSKQRLSAKRGGPTQVQILPTHKFALCKIDLSDMRASEIHGSKPAAAGAVYTSRAFLTKAWMWWTHDFEARQLHVCRFASMRVEGMEAHYAKILEAAMAEASACGLWEVVIWDPTAQFIAGARMVVAALNTDKLNGPEIILEPRYDKIPCLRWRGGEDVAAEWIERQMHSCF